jgi:hypothetical protein
MYATRADMYMILPSAILMAEFLPVLLLKNCRRIGYALSVALEKKILPPNNECPLRR